MWNVVITEVRYEPKKKTTSAIKRFDAHGINVGHVELLVIALWHRKLDKWTE
jgi:hypothetical protein